MKSKLLPYQILMGVVSAAIGGIVAVLGDLRDELGFNDTGIGIVVAAGFLASFVAQIALARYADRGYGRQMATFGIALSAAALLVMAISDDIGFWIASRAALGFAGGMIVPGLRRAATVMDPSKVGENLGRLIAAEVTGFLFGPVIAAVLVESIGLRAPFVAFGILMIIFLPFAASMEADGGLQDERTSGTSLDLLLIRRLQGALILIFGYFIIIGAFESVLPVMFKDRGGGSLETGIAFTVLAAPMAAVSTYAGGFADRVGPAKVAVIGMGVVGLMTTTYGWLPGLIVPTVLMGIVAIGDGFGFTAAQVVVARAVPEDRQAGALGLMGAAEVLGAGLAAVPAAMVYGEWGAEIAWLATGVASLVVLAIGGLRLRGTDPLTAARASPKETARTSAL